MRKFPKMFKWHYESKNSFLTMKKTLILCQIRNVKIYSSSSPECVKQMESIDFHWSWDMSYWLFVFYSFQNSSVFTKRKVSNTQERMNVWTPERSELRTEQIRMESEWQLGQDQRSSSVYSYFPFPMSPPVQLSPGTLSRIVCHLPDPFLWWLSFTSLVSLYCHPSTLRNSEPLNKRYKIH